MARKKTNQTMDSSIEELCLNNNPPSVDVVKNVWKLVLKPLQDVRDLDFEILMLERRLKELKDKRNETHQWISRYQCILSPIRRLPGDVLGEIFQHCIPVHTNPIMKGTESPLLLTRVCKLWRSVALSEPRLWSKIHIAFVDPPSESVSLGDQVVLQARLDAVKEWLSRSGATPLSISALFRRPDNPSGYSPHQVTLGLLRFISHLSPRIEDLELSLSLKTFRLLETMIDTSKMTNLISLRISSAGRISSKWHRKPLSLLKAPKLRRVYTFGCDSSVWGVSDPSNSSVWSRLTHLSCHGRVFYEDETMFLLAHATNLVHLSIIISHRYGGHDEDIPIPPQGPISLPFLRTLFLTDCMTARARDEFYERMDAPGLKWLMIETDKIIGYDPSTPIPIISFLRRVTRLEKLTINSTSLEAWNMRNVFIAVPSITHLFIGNELKPESSIVLKIQPNSFARPQPFDFHLLSSNDTDSDSPLLPNLESFEINAPCTLIDDDDILRFIKYRMAPPPNNGLSALKHVTFGFRRTRVDGRDLVEDVRRHAECLGVEMIDLVVGYEKPPLEASRVPEPESGLMKVEVPTGVEANVNNYVRFRRLE